MSYIKEALAESQEYFSARVDQDIEKNRKSDFTVSVQKNGQPVENAVVCYKLDQLDFEFGCNLFMLDQYDDPDKQETYNDQWKHLFNTAVVPLYWEGTEPEQDYLRYDADTPNDVYRRPPADRVVKFCQDNSITMKGHPLFWQEFTAKWLPDDWDSIYPLLEKRFKEISERYADIIPVFDAVNEPSRLWDQQFEKTYKTKRKCIFPPEGYLEEVFALAKQYFPNNTLILNDTVGASFGDFRGVYGGYYQLIDRLLGENLKIDRIGLQCHTSDSDYYKNVFHSERLYSLLDTYGKFNKPLVLSEISISVEDENVQAEATERLYKTCFSHRNMSGIFWWNLDDNGILCAKDRAAAVGENLPYGGLVRNGRPKPAYKVLDKLIHEEWTTHGESAVHNGKCDFRGFYGTYTVTVTCGGEQKTVTVDFSKNSDKAAVIEL